MMTNVILLAFLSIAFANCTQSREDVSVYVDDFLVKANTFINKKGLNTLNLPEVTNEGWFFKRFLSSGTIGDLGSFRRRHNATMDTLSQGNVTHYNIGATIGLNSLIVQYHFLFEVLWVFKTSGKIKVTTKRNSIKIDSMVIKDSTSGFCDLAVNNAEVVELEDFDVGIEQAGFLRMVIQRFVKSALRNFIPNLISVVNSELYDLFRNYPINQNLTRDVCKYF